MTPSVSVVIPTLVRPTLHRAVMSVLGQTIRVEEIIVVAPPEVPVPLPADDRIRVLRAEIALGPVRRRQRGIEAAHGSVIALLDDDDEWYPTKLQRQLAAVGVEAGDCWIASSRMAVIGPGTRRRTWPRRLVEPGESIADYLFRFTGFTSGGAVLQTSTLCFPAELVRTVPWCDDGDAAHEEPDWLIRVQRAIPCVQVIQLEDVLSTYDVGGLSVSRSTTDRTDEYIEWGLSRLRTESPRVRGDYLCTSPVSAAVFARSLSGVRRSLWSSLRHGRPGPFALTYAVLSAVRIVLHRPRASIR